MGRLVLIKSVHLCLQNPFSGLGVNARTSTLSVPATPTDDTFWAVSFAPHHPALPRLLWPTPISPIPCSAQRDSTTPKTEKNGGFPHPEERVRLCPRQAAGARGGKGGDRGPGTPKATKAQTQCCHSRGRAVGPGPSCPDTIGAAPRATCVHCAPAAPPPPQPLLSVPHRIMDPLCVLGWTRTLFRRKKLCLSVRRDRPRKGRGGAAGSVPRCSPQHWPCAARRPQPPSHQRRGGVPTGTLTRRTARTFSHLAKHRQHPPTPTSSLQTEPQRGFASPPHPQVPRRRSSGWAQPNLHGMAAPTASLRANAAGWEPSPPSSQPRSRGLSWLPLGHPQSGPFYPVFVPMSPRAAPRSEGSPGTTPWAARGS